MRACGGAVPESSLGASPDGALERPSITDVSSHLRFWMLFAVGVALDLWSKHWAFHTLFQGGRRVLIPNVLEFHTTMNSGALFGIGAGRTGLFVVASVIALGLVLWMFAQCPARRWGTQIALGAILAGAMGNMYDRVFVRLVDVSTPRGRVWCVAEEVPAPANIGVPGLGVPGAAVPSSSPAAHAHATPDAAARELLLREYPPDAENQPGVQMFTQRLPLGALGDVQAVGCVRDFIKISQKWFGGKDVWPWVFNVADMLLVGGVAILALRLIFEARPQRVPPITDADSPS